MHDSPIFLPLHDQHTKLRQGALSAVELVES